MAIPHAKSGEVIYIRPLGAALAKGRTTTLVKTKSLKILRLVIPSGEDIPEHQALEKSRSSAWRDEWPLGQAARSNTWRPANGLTSQVMSLIRSTVSKTLRFS